jgi:hypothetical protein
MDHSIKCRGCAPNQRTSGILEHFAVELCPTLFSICAFAERPSGGTHAGTYQFVDVMTISFAVLSAHTELSIIFTYHSLGVHVSDR